jgi:hypothetical protein
MPSVAQAGDGVGHHGHVLIDVAGRHPEAVQVRLVPYLEDRVEFAERIRDERAIIAERLPLRFVDDAAVDLAIEANWPNTGGRFELIAK